VLLVSLVIARVIAESGAPMPALTDDAVLLIKRANVVVGDGCGGSDAGVDAGVGDAGTIDAPDDAGPTDAGVPDAPGCTTIPGDAITMVVQPRFMTDPQGMRFAVLFVTPTRPVVETKSSYLFEDLASVTAPKIEIHKTYVEDPAYGKECGSTGCGAEQESSGCEATPSWEPPSLGDGGLGDGGLVVETIGPYEVLRAEPADATELASWLTGLGYRYDQADLDAVTPYIALDYTVIAVRVAVGQPTTTTFAPIALTWAGSELRLPVAFGTAPANVATTVYIAGDGRYDLPGAEVPFADRTSFGDAGYLTRNELVLDSTAPPVEDPVAVRVAGDPTAREIVVEQKTIRVPVNDCGSEIGCCGNCSTGRSRIRPDMIVVVLACGYVLRRKRRRRE